MDQYKLVVIVIHIIWAIVTILILLLVIILLFMVEELLVTLINFIWVMLFADLWVFTDLLLVAKLSIYISVFILILKHIINIANLFINYH